jgi:tRNA(Ile)-lysidine synthase
MEPVEFSADVARTARRFGMDLSRPLAMVSGGPDSVALAHSLVELGSRPVVLHVDHGLRGEESREDAEFVLKLCESMDLVYEERWAKFKGGNLQEEARRERYRFAEQLADERGLSAIATGHTADDVTETVVLNLARGTGLRGLSGIPPVRGRVVRPLIRLRRRDVLRYLEQLGQQYRTDPTNLTPKYARNRVRLEVMPVLEELYPGAGENVARTASLLREDLEALENLAAGLVRRRGEEAAVPLDELWRVPPALRRYAVREAYSAVVPKAAPLGFVAVEGILELARGGEGTREVHLPALATAVVRSGEQQELVLYRKRDKAYTGEQDLLPGTQDFERWIVEVREVWEFSPTDAARPEVAYLDASAGPYRVRMAQEGDTIRPVGLGGTKKVYKAMKDRKVPRDIRTRTPVVIDGRGRVAWVFMGELGEEFGVEAETTGTLRVEVERIP